MSQFKILIDEREEAKRNFEQLKAEIGSINSGLDKPSNGSSKAQPKESMANQAEASEIQSASIPEHEIELASYKSQNLPAYLPDTVLPAAPAVQTKPNKPNLTPANIEPGTSYGDKPQGSDAVKRILIALMHGVTILFCCPCYLLYMRQKRLRKGSLQGVGPAPIQEFTLAPYPYGPVETAYLNLESYGPEGVFELAGGDPIPVLPPPTELGGYYRS
jgi:hypothetical protein